MTANGGKAGTLRRLGTVCLAVGAVAGSVGAAALGFASSGPLVVLAGLAVAVILLTR